MVLSISGVNYTVKFDYNSICDTNLLDLVGEISELFQEDTKEDGTKRVMKLFSGVRELLFVGFAAGGNPVDTKQEVGALIDAYRREGQEGEERGILDLFVIITKELVEEGFLSDLMSLPAVETEETDISKAKKGKKKA